MDMACNLVSSDRSVGAQLAGPLIEIIIYKGVRLQFDARSFNLSQLISEIFFSGKNREDRDAN